MAIRIISGDLAGRKLEIPVTQIVRPMGQRLKKSLFGILGDDVVEAKTLDLFAGAGSFSFEALSLGAKQATAVEQSPVLVEYLYKNAARLELEEDLRVYEENVLTFLDIVNPATPYDIIFIDPPYGQGLTFKSMELLEGWPGFGPTTTLVTRTFKKEGAYDNFSFVVYREKKIGDDLLVFYRL
jgi:16S rRNA (guanine966-N2)-methyltransferase